MTFSSLNPAQPGEKITAAAINDIISAGVELEKILGELEKQVGERPASGPRGPRGRAGVTQPVLPPVLEPAGLDLLTAAQVDHYRDLLTSLGCVVPSSVVSGYYALYASDVSTVTGTDNLDSPVQISPRLATWVLTALDQGTTYTLARSSKAGTYTPDVHMGTEPLAVLMGTPGGTTTTTQRLVAGAVSGTGAVAQITDCPIAQIRWAALGDGVYQPIVIPMYIPLI